MRPRYRAARTCREIEFDLLPFLTSKIKSAKGRMRDGKLQISQIPLMAYSPVGHSGQLLKNRILRKIARAHDATPAQIALAWVLRQPNVIAIPKASAEAHVRDNAASLKIKLTTEDLNELDREFPPPKTRKPLPVL